MSEESPRQRIRKIRQESERRLRELTVQLGENLLKSKGIALPEAQSDRERLAQIEAYKNLILEKTRELETWTQHRNRAANHGMTKPCCVAVSRPHDLLRITVGKTNRGFSLAFGFWPVFC
jgi:hypothetical protein